MTADYAGRIMLSAGSDIPEGYLACDGRSYSVDDYPQLYRIIGTTYGGDGVNTFAVPDMRNKVPVHQGVLPGGSSYVLGQFGGSATVTLTDRQLGGHYHQLLATTGTVPESTATPIQGTSPGDEPYTVSGSIFAYHTPTTESLVAMSPENIGFFGGELPHENAQPNLSITICICAVGVEPS